MIRTRVGYTGGVKDHPTYRSLGDHTETVEVDYDPARVSYAELFAIYTSEIDPFARPYSQQYKAVVWYHDQAQQRVAEQWRAALEAQRGRKVQTELRPAGQFWRAEDYHQKYYLRHSNLLTGEIAAYYAAADGFTDSTVAARLNGYLGGHGSAAQLEGELTSYGLSPAAQEQLRRLTPRLEP